MDYPLENLTPETFQQLCQALLTNEYPNVQCYPVAQPDGGRDAVEWKIRGPKDEFAVFQVKFVRKPLSEPDPHKWLVNEIEGELPKIKGLIPRGASKYILLTNVPGTAHFEAGSIDKLDAILSELSIPVTCWWRDDINRRLDGAWSIKWSYPEIMTGPDFLRAVIESGLHEHRERRDSAIRAFLRHQYEIDEEVRFKQIELQNKLLDLFIDVPIAPKDLSISHEHNSSYRAVARAVHGSKVVADTILSDSSGYLLLRHPHEAPPIGTASALLSSEGQNTIPHVVIEGAPGQGKSTIVQYICQVHRMRLLRETAALHLTPKTHQTVPIRLPIKVDLRDFATWINRKNPFVAQGDELPSGWHKSLESFLAALISNQSGGMSFSADDLLAVAKISSLLVVFDGLDEVADIATRSEVVEEILRGVQRLQENAASIQTIVTSRPAAFANSPGMPERKYLFLQLLSLSTDLIITYAERWMAARHLETSLREEFRKLLKTKLDQPHLRDLARNPMQLAILLSLLHTRGASLPEKRTALYDQYMDLFFSREAGKSSVVRDHRDLLIEIHRYLAWTLHCDAEKGEARASITQEKLHTVVAEYLSSEGYNPELASMLFSGMLERVVVLVSRVQGTYEFEVQPLREYFAACFLFYTAPNSSPGRERTGSRPDRFYAIARNFSWLNVTRFYAGCYSKGELPSLVELLQDLCVQEDYDLISDPRVLALTLAADWVFSQNPRSVHQVVELIMQPAGLRRLLTTIGPRRRWHSEYDELPTLPSGCGKEQLLTRGFEWLETSEHRQFALDICKLLRANGDTNDLSERWFLAFRRNVVDSTRWFKYGLELGVLTSIPHDQLRSIFDDVQKSPAGLRYLVKANRVDVFEDDEGSVVAAIAMVLDGSISHDIARTPSSPISALIRALRPELYVVAFNNRVPARLSDVLAMHAPSTDIAFTLPNPCSEILLACVRVVETAKQQSNRPAIDWATEIEPWDIVVSSATTVWGETRSLLMLAAVAAGIRSKTETCTDSTNLLDRTRSLCRRTRFARLKAGVSSYWKLQLEEVADEHDIALVILIMFTWAKPRAIVDNLDQVGRLLERLGEDQWKWLHYAIRRCRHLGGVGTSSVDMTKLPEQMKMRLGCILAAYVDTEQARLMFKRYIRDGWEQEPVATEYAFEDALDRDRLGRSKWSPNLEVLRACEKKGFVGFHHGSVPIRRIPLRVAREIARDPLSYPGFLVGLAQQRCRLRIAEKALALADIARRDRWFEA